MDNQHHLRCGKGTHAHALSYGEQAVRVHLRDLLVKSYDFHGCLNKSEALFSLMVHYLVEVDRHGNVLIVFGVIGLRFNVRRRIYTVLGLYFFRFLYRGHQRLRRHQGSIGLDQFSRFVNRLTG